MTDSKIAKYTAGKLAKAAGVNVQTVRFYDRKGVLKPTSRTKAGYRIYDSEGLKRLNFIIQAKELGFSLKEIKDLLSLRVRSDQSCDKVQSKAKAKLEDIQGKVSDLRRLERTLKKLIKDCENRVVSDQCPILERMEL